MREIGELMNTVQEGFQRLGWRYTVNETDHVITCGVRDESGDFDVSIIAFAAPDCAVVLCKLPVVVPEHKRTAAADAVNRANFGRLVGIFEMDPTSGRVFCKASIPIEGTALTVDQFLSVLATVVELARQYHRAFARLVFGDDLSAAEVVAEVEMAKANARDSTQ